MAIKTAFLQIFGESPVLRVLDFLVVNEDFDYSMTDIASLSGVGYSTLKLFWSRLEDTGIVKQTRIVGKAKMYRLNFDNPVVKKFRDFYWETTKAAVHGKKERKFVIN
ncbi:helix-turn-helix transcriptional regulator [Candidatus Woesearchaeota archaeon]|nr:helix-turn-helix transcriptional regulator [Candidatus Woesearchaeota archaeon]